MGIDPRSSSLSFVTCFKHLGHIIANTVYGDSDINRELTGLIITIIIIIIVIIIHTRMFMVLSVIMTKAIARVHMVHLMNAD